MARHTPILHRPRPPALGWKGPLACAALLALSVLTNAAPAGPDSTNAADPGKSPAPASSAVVVTNAPAAPAQTNAPSTAAHSTGESSTPANGFQPFAMIADRNIFNASRRPHSKSGRGEAPPPAPKVDIISLAGTLIYAKGDYAFFDSNTADYRKVVKVGDEIAGYKLKEVEQTQVSLARSNEVTRLKVGEQLRREGAGAWKITSGALFSSAAAGSSRGYSGTSPASAAETSEKPESTSAEGPSEALKRLLEKVKKEKSK
jgi:hypothetical protein